MRVPFSAEQFIAVFAAYNAAIWPAQAVAYALGLAAVAALWADGALGKRLILTVLATFWAINGIGYHFSFFAGLNPLAVGFAAMFVLQAILFLSAAIATSGLRFRLDSSPRSVVALILIFYAMVIYELLGHLAGHGLMRGPLFGVAPCPTAIFTLGMLLLAEGRFVAWLAVIPIVWALIGSSAAVLFGMPEDFGLAAAALSLVVVLAKRGFAGRNPNAAARQTLTLAKD